MKRKLLLLLFLLLYFLGFSQSQLYVISTDGTSSGYGDWNYDTLLYRQGIHEINSSETTIIIDFYDGYNDDPSYGCGGPCGQYQDHCQGVEIDINIKYFQDFLISKPDECLPLDYRAVLLPKITAPADRRCERQELFPQHSDGINHNVNGLVWEYVNNLGQWEELPNFKNRYPLNVSLLDIFGSNWRNYFNGNLQLRFKFTASFTSDVIYSIQNYTITLTECSPELQSLVPHKTKCNYSEDGSFTFSVDRDLVDTEKLIATLFYEYSTGYDLATNPQEVITSLTSNTDGTYGYTWQGDLPPGNYRLKYQTLKGSGTISPNDSSWASLESENFTLNPSDPVQFFAQKLNDEICFERGDGQIQLYDVDGEDGRTFLYRVFKVNTDNSMEIYKDWTNFSGNNTTINGLGKNKYRIKVKDNLGCLAK
ncbi:hypothetical protein [Tenacibaculum sp. IB213877]|uniref:hypothetical protein n=1 Tax=Tenacibaculum sp. IB213877 TaxID=3097351 RepID=UPI002A59E342|nr:hypothetical protein [Tenacibaculum sp. IB213877]MDY0779346.1 hypothetical protein [Tenacibaculum sp. IB213877]